MTMWAARSFHLCRSQMRPWKSSSLLAERPLLWTSRFLPARSPELARRIASVRGQPVHVRARPPQLTVLRPCSQRQQALLQEWEQVRVQEQISALRSEEQHSTQQLLEPARALRRQVAHAPSMLPARE
jgi:hypothetical protein